MGDFVHPLVQERVKEPASGLIQEFRACSSDYLDDGELGNAAKCRWHESRGAAEEDLRMVRNDPIEWHETWLETRWRTPAFKLDEAAAAGAVVDVLAALIRETR